MMTIAQIMEKMIAFSEGNIQDVYKRQVSYYKDLWRDV